MLQEKNNLKPKIIIKSNYNRFKSQTEIVEKAEPRTKQSFKEECDINNIVRAYRPNQNGTRIYQFDDYTNVDFFEMQNSVAAGTEKFLELPSHIRKKFDNNVGNLIRFINDKNNKTEAITLGLIDKPQEQPLKQPETSQKDDKKGSPPPDGGVKPSDA